MPVHDSVSVLQLRLRALANRLRESQLFLPTIMLVIAVALELTLAWAGERLGLHRLPFGLRLSPDAAISLLSTIAGATITTAGVVFSILVVSLQLASGQFSPRVLRSFYRDRGGQVVIGLLVSTFAFCVLALTAINSSASTPRIPVLSVEVATLLALLSILGIVGYLDRMSHRQYVGSIADRIAAETLDVLPGLQRREPGMTLLPPASVPHTGDGRSGYVVPAPADGWVQQLSRRLVLDSLPAGSVVRLETRVGAFVVRGGPLATIWPEPPDARRVSRAMDDAVIIRSARSMQQDADFGLRQLCDIALRALSPAVNDPTTAIEIVMRLASIMRPLLAGELPAQALRDDKGRVLLHPYDLDHGEYVRHAFEQVRQAASAQPAVVLAIIRTLRMLDGVALAHGRADARAELNRQLTLAVEGAAKAHNLPDDVETLRRAAADAGESAESNRAELDH